MTQDVSPYDATPPRCPIQHIGYVVADIPQAVDRWVSMFGAGPFFWLGQHIDFDESDHLGAPCVLDHSAVIGRWENTFVELAEVVSERFHKLAAAGDLQAEPAKMFVALLDEVGRK